MQRFSVALVSLFLVVAVAEGAGVGGAVRVNSSELGEERSSTEYIQRLRLFAEPLLPIGGVPGTEENRALTRAIQRFSQRALPDDFSALEDFITQHPASPWTPSLRFNLGIEFYITGWYSRAVAAWEMAWQVLKSVADPAAKPLVDRAAG